MQTTLLALVALTAGLATAGEPSHPLELVLKRAPGTTGVQVAATVDNSTKKRVYLQIATPEDFVVIGHLTAEDGSAIEGTHLWAAKGAPLMGYRYEEIGPWGEAVIGSWAYDDATTTALGGAHRWDLQPYRGQRIAVRFTFSQPCLKVTVNLSEGTPLDVLTRPPRNTREVFCGELESEPYTVGIPAWNRENVLSTLAEVPVLAPEVFDILVTDAVVHEDAEVRANAAFSLGEMDWPRAAPALALLLSDRERTVRGYAARALGDLANPEALEALKVAGEREADDWVRDAIYEAIRATERGQKDGAR